MSDPTKAVEETAKAAAEIAKTADTALELAGKAGSFVAKVFGDTAAQLGGMATDQVKMWRYQRLLSIQDKVNEIHRRRGIEGKTIPVLYKIGLPMLEAASLEDEETLQSMWARLIANAMDPAYSETIHPAYAEVLKQLSADEALIIETLATSPGRSHVFFCDERTLGERREHFSRTKQQYADFFRVFPGMKQPESRMRYLENLLRLQILALVSQDEPVKADLNITVIDGGTFAEPRHEETDSRNSVTVNMKTREAIKLTAFGRAFIEACLGDPSQKGRNL